MEKSEFDVVIIGGGHNALTCAAYLGRAGVDVCVLEGRHEWGGALYTAEHTAPGFSHNIHANFMEFLHYMPFYADFDLAGLGARTIFPEAQAGIAFSDGRPPVVIYREDMIERTCESFAVYSKRDAEVWRDLKTRANDLAPMMFESLYTPPAKFDLQKDGLPYANRSPMTFKFFGLDEEMAFKSIRDCIDELWESDEIRALMYRVAVEFCGPPIEWPGMGGTFLFGCLWMPGCWRMIVGGTHRLNGAMVTACLKEGVTMREASRIERVILEGGKAVGVETVDGRQFMARQAVVSGIGLKDTFLDLVGEGNLSPYCRRRVENFKDGPDQVLGSVAMALHEAPDYKSAVHNPDINRAWYQVVGYDTSQEVLEYCRAGHIDRIPELPGAGLWVNSLWDPTQAPPGKHNLTGWYFFPRASTQTEAEWDDVKRSYNARFLSLYEKFAPNMTPANVIADYLHTPLDQELGMRMREGDFGHGAMGPDQMGIMRPFAGASRYATEIEGLYLCGSCTHPGGGVTAGPGYNCFKILCEDFGYPEIWRKEGRTY